MSLMSKVVNNVQMASLSQEAFAVAWRHLLMTGQYVGSRFGLKGH